MLRVAEWVLAAQVAVWVVVPPVKNEARQRSSLRLFVKK
jgi:hypothetical protein